MNGIGNHSYATNSTLSKSNSYQIIWSKCCLRRFVYDDAYAKALEIQKETGATFLHPFNDEYVIAGQGTIALEIFEQMNNKVDTILCPIGGGALTEPVN